MSDLNYTIPVSVQRLINHYKRQTEAKEALATAPKLKISEAVGKLAFFYEKIRNSIDYREENLLLKATIQRVLKRRFVPGEDPAAIARPLISELIRGGYIANKSLPESILDDLALILVKYARLLNKCIPLLDQETREEIFEWILMLAACEIEEAVTFSWERKGMQEFVYLTMLERIQIKAKNLDEDQRRVQIYIATLRTHCEYDFDLTTYNVLKFFYPDWRDHKEDTLNQVAQNIVNIKQTIEKQFKHPLQERLARQMKQINVLFTILGDLLRKHEDPITLLQNTPALEELIEETTTEKYKEVKGKLRRTSVRSIIYLFFTKMVLAISLEAPYDYFIVGHLEYVPILINIIFHPLLLFMIALLVHIPAKENTKKIIEGIKDLVYEYKGKEIVYYVRPKVQRSKFANFVFRFLYLIAYVITFGIIFIFLDMLNFNWLGMALFFMFITLVSFFGLRVRQLAKNLVVIDRKDNLISAAVDFFSIPVVRAGRWLSINFSKMNVFIFVLDVIIEAPFKLIIEVFEDWLGYIREKREEIYD